MRTLFSQCIFEEYVIGTVLRPIKEHTFTLEKTRIERTAARTDIIRKHKYVVCNSFFNLLPEKYLCVL